MTLRPSLTFIRNSPARRILLIATCVMLTATNSFAKPWWQKKVETVTTPPHVNLPKPKVTLPKPKVTLPKPKVTLPKPKVTLPKPKVTLPKPKVTLPRQTVNLPRIPTVNVLQRQRPSGLAIPPLVSPVIERIGGDLAKGAKVAGGDFARESKRFGGDVARESKRVGGDIAREGKQVSGDVAREAKHARDEVSEKLVAGRDKVSLPFRRAGGEASDWSKEHVNKPVGKPWNRGVRDPWVRWLNRGYSTGQDRLDKADEKYDRGINDAASRVGDANTGDKFKYRDVPDGSVKESEYGKSLLAIDAPNGGQVGYDIPEYMEGRKVKITMLVRVDKGQARIGLADTDGKQTSFSEAGISKLTVIPKGEEWKLGFQEVSFVTEIPVNDRAHDGTDKAHNYRSLLQVDPGSKVHLAAVRIERAD